MHHLWGLKRLSAPLFLRHHAILFCLKAKQEEDPTSAITNPFVSSCPSHPAPGHECGHHTLEQGAQRDEDKGIGARLVICHGERGNTRLGCCCSDLFERRTLRDIVIRFVVPTQHMPPGVISCCCCAVTFEVWPHGGHACGQFSLFVSFGL